MHVTLTNLISVVLYMNRNTKNLIVLKLKMTILLLFNNMGEHEKFMNSVKVQEK